MWGASQQLLKHPIVKCIFDKHIMCSIGLCGHSALGLLSDTLLRDAVFGIHLFRKQTPDITKSENIKDVTKIRNVSYSACLS